MLLVNNNEYMSFHHQALSFYLIACYLLFKDLGYGDLKISTIIDPVKARGNVIPMLIK